MWKKLEHAFKCEQKAFWSYEQYWDKGDWVWEHDCLARAIEIPAGIRGNVVSVFSRAPDGVMYTDTDMYLMADI